MAKWWSARRFDLLELGLISALASLAALAVPSSGQSHPERTLLEDTYGPDRFSENEEEWIVRDFFQDRRDGFFVDVGAGHYQANSNTYHLEHELGWSGIAVEPFRHFEADFQNHRPRTRFLPFFVSDVTGQQVKMFTLGEKFLASSSDASWVQRFGESPQEVMMPTSTLTDLLEKEGVSTFNFMSMDIELAEPLALAGFDVERFRPDLVCIEAHPEVRQQILDYFTRHRYVIVGEYLRADEKNLYFKPL